ncbi:hypothetical protein Gpo141_00009682 [Globisporangium polare]
MYISSSSFTLRTERQQRSLEKLVEGALRVYFLDVISLEHVYSLDGAAGFVGDRQGQLGRHRARALLVQRVWHLPLLPDPDHAPSSPELGSLAFLSASWSFSAVIFLIVLFLVAPGILLGLVCMCTASSVVTQVFGWFIAAVALCAGVGLSFWHAKKGGREVWHAFLEKNRDAQLDPSNQQQQQQALMGETAV